MGRARKSRTLSLPSPSFAEGLQQQQKRKREGEKKRIYTSLSEYSRARSRECAQPQTENILDLWLETIKRRSFISIHFAGAGQHFIVSTGPFPPACIFLSRGISFFDRTLFDRVFVACFTGRPRFPERYFDAEILFCEAGFCGIDDRQDETVVVDDLLVLMVTLV